MTRLSRLLAFLASPLGVVLLLILAALVYGGWRYVGSLVLP